MSSESRWLSPPVKKTRIIDLARGLVPAVAPLGFAAATPSCESPTRQKAGQAESEKAAETHLEKLAADQIGRMGIAQRHRVSLNRSAIRRTRLLNNN